MSESTVVANDAPDAESHTEQQTAVSDKPLLSQEHHFKGPFKMCENKDALFVDDSIVEQLLTEFAKYQVRLELRRFCVGMWSPSNSTSATDAQQKEQDSDATRKDRRWVDAQMYDAACNERMWLRLRTEAYCMHSYRVKMELGDAWDLFFVYLLTGMQTRALYFNSFNNVVPFVAMVLNAYAVFVNLQEQHMRLEESLHLFRNTPLPNDNDDASSTNALDNVQKQMRERKKAFDKSGEHLTTLLRALREFADTQMDYAPRKMTIFMMDSFMKCTAYTYMRNCLRLSPDGPSMVISVHPVIINEPIEPNPVIVTDSNGRIRDTGKLTKKNRSNRTVKTKNNDLSNIFPPEEPLLVSSPSQPPGFGHRRRTTRAAAPNERPIASNGQVGTALRDDTHSPILDTGNKSFRFTGRNAPDPLLPKTSAQQQQQQQQQQHQSRASSTHSRTPSSGRKKKSPIRVVNAIQKRPQSSEQLSLLQRPSSIDPHSARQHQPPPPSSPPRSSVPLRSQSSDSVSRPSASLQQHRQKLDYYIDTTEQGSKSSSTNTRPSRQQQQQAHRKQVSAPVQSVSPTNLPLLNHQMAPPTVYASAPPPAGVVHPMFVATPYHVQQQNAAAYLQALHLHQHHQAFLHQQHQISLMQQQQQQHTIAQDTEQQTQQQQQQQREQLTESGIRLVDDGHGNFSPVQ